MLTTKRFEVLFRGIVLVLLTFVFILVTGCSSFSTKKQARQILQECGVQGGLIVHLGCGEGKLIATLGANEKFLIQGLERNLNHVERAREYIQSKNLYGNVSVDQIKKNQLPYINNLVNLIIVEDLFNISLGEVMRVICPGGVAYVKKGATWEKTVKPVSEDLDEWTHYLHGPDGNPVSHDLAVGPPRKFQWIGSPKWARHHDRMASMSALVSASGRIFYIMDEGSTASILLPSKWKLVARDAFNGTVLWKRPIEKWHTHLWPLKSGPAQLPRRLVATGDKVYVTLGINAPVCELDAASGETIRTYQNTLSTEEIILSDGILFLLINQNPVDSVYKNVLQIRDVSRKEFWSGQERKIMAVDSETGEVLWSSQRSVLPVTLAANTEGLFFHDGEKVVCLDRTNGRERWSSKPISRTEKILSFFAPILMVYEDVVLFAGGETAGLQTGSWYEEGEDNMTAFSAETGEILWKSYHPPSGYRSPEDILVVNNLVWTGETTSGEVAGEFTGRDLHTGEVKSRFVPDVDTYWFHHRCYRSKATDRYLLTSRNGIEYINPLTQKWEIHHWVRGGCLYGIMPSNGLVYAPPHDCACYPEAKLFGFCVLATESNDTKVEESNINVNRLESGPAYTQSLNSSNIPTEANSWPTYRYDSSRSGFTKTSLPAELKNEWVTRLGGKLSSIVVADNKVFVAKMDAHTLYALDANSGKIIWNFTTGGPIDSPPTVYKGLVLFGSADGYVYCLSSSDGKMCWRFLAAPYDLKMVAFEQLESLWPVPGSVLVQGDIVYFVCGRSMYLDGGMRLYRLDYKTGKSLSVTVLDDRDPETGENLQIRTNYLTLPVALPDILSSDGLYLYMRSQRFDLEGNRLEVDPMSKEPFDKLFHQRGKNLQHVHKDNYLRFLEDSQQKNEGVHLFSPTGFLDGSWFHRSYWVYGKHFTGGWNGYYLAGQFSPSGRLLVFNQDRVYGFGRKPQYYRWTTPLEYHLYSTKKYHRINTAVIEEGAQKGRLKTDESLPLYWAHSLPLLVRSLVLADEKLISAGPPDLIDEEQVINRLSDAEIQTKLKEQDEALEDLKGALLWIVSANNGDKLAEYQLESTPVWDGLAVAYNKLYFSTQDGSILCMGEVKSTNK